MPITRRALLLVAASAPLAARAHHGWSSFDQDRPIYLEGTARNVKWRNPHAEFMLEVTAGLKLPADLPNRTLPAQTSAVDGKAILARATLPRRTETRWEIELAPLQRLNAWQVPEIKEGQHLGLLGFTFKEDKGEPVLRAEYLFLNGKVYGMRSSPA
ncbi:hypothetical protein FVQ98_04355 [Ottowia sp. GY511]|uniref:DUF6152 family protein n=1 Tax=Ottowia flava TaxID=2675430 RepID=A0ABW4KX86_9BURK|nr:DUF6152 family protein [Ottowia sp. GY511]TXK31218.1 hypothetical protein FVQ98_04355 [Ottowia sp. GY511]